jgi:hypothetical protein
MGTGTDIGAAVPEQRGEASAVERFRATVAHAAAKRFKMPGTAKEVPPERRLAAVSAWAGVLGLGGALIALRLTFSLFRPGFDWSGAVVTLIGAVGLLATIGAFTSIHRRRAPWILLTIGSVALLLSCLVIALA